MSVSYRDLPVRIIVSLVAAHFIVSFGIDKSFFEFLLLADYYRSLAGSFAIAFTLFTLVRTVTLQLDRRFSWLEKSLQRALMQVLFGLVFIAVAAFLLAAVYFSFYGINILKTGYLKYDFPVICLFILLLNVYYFAYYLVQQLRRKDEPATVITYTEVIVVNKGTENVPVPVEQIAYFYHEGDYNFVRLFNGEDFLIPQTLDEIEQSLDPVDFFRVNRQMIAQFDACKSFQNLENGKLELKPAPAFKSQVVISQKRAPEFKKWLGRS